MVERGVPELDAQLNSLVGRVSDIERRLRELAAPGPLSTGSLGGREYATVVIAAADTHDDGKHVANHVCSGRNDQITINRAIAGLPLVNRSEDIFTGLPDGPWGRVVLLEGNYSISATVLGRLPVGDSTVYSTVDLCGVGSGTVLHAEPDFLIPGDYISSVIDLPGLDGDVISTYAAVPIVRDLTINLHRVQRVRGLTMSNASALAKAMSVTVINPCEFDGQVEVAAFDFTGGHLYDCHALSGSEIAGAAAIGFYDRAKTVLQNCEIGKARNNLAGPRDNALDNFITGIFATHGRFFDCNIRGEAYAVQGNGASNPRSKIVGGTYRGSIYNVKQVTGATISSARLDDGDEPTTLEFSGLDRPVAQSNIILSSGNKGIGVFGCDGARILGNALFDYDNDGIYIEESTRTSVIGNTGQCDSGPTGFALTIDGGCDETYYFANDFLDGGGISDSGTNSDSTSTNRT